MPGNGPALRPAQPKPCKPAHQDRQDLAERARYEDDEENSAQRNASAFSIGAKALRHAPYGLGHDSDSDDLETMDNAGSNRSRETAGAIGEEHQQDCRWQCERGPRRCRASRAGPQEAERETDLARSGTGQEVGERDKIGKFFLTQPSAPDHEFIVKIAQMGDRPAERAHAQLQEGSEDFGRAARGLAVPDVARIRIVHPPVPVPAMVLARRYGAHEFKSIARTNILAGSRGR